MNPEAVKPRKMILLGILIPILVGGIMSMLATGVAGKQNFYENIPSVLCAFIMIISFFAMLLSLVAKCDWQTKYFGLSSLYFGCFSLFGIIPWLCIVLYGRIPLWERVVLFVVYIAVVFWWCRRFISVYKIIMSDEATSKIIYQEEKSAIYYIQDGDSSLLDKRLKFHQSPPPFLYVVMAALGFLLFIFKDFAYAAFGTPRIHIFLFFAFFPFVLLTLGLAMRGFLIYYYYPMVISRKTGKKVYVDLATKSVV